MEETDQTSREKSHSVLNINEYTSKTNLTSNNDQFKEIYDPFAARDQGKGNSTSSSLTHLLKCSLGSGILAMPLAFRNAGLLFGLVGTILVGFLCTHCVHILVKTSQSVCRDAQLPALSFSDTAEKVFELGPKRLRPWSRFAKHFVDIALMLTYYAGTSVYIVFISTSFHDVINYDTGLDWNVRIYIGMTLIPLLLIGQVRSLKYLVPFSTGANIFVVISFAITLYYIFNEPLVFSDKPLMAKFEQLPAFFATVVFAMEGIGAVMPVENTMKKPQHFLGCPGVLTTAMSIVVALYSAIGFLGYLRYGDKVLGSITLNLEIGSPLADTGKILMALSVLLSFGLLFYIPNEILWNKIGDKFSEKNCNIAQVVMRFSITIVSGIVAAAIPNLEPFIGLVGAIFLSLLGIFIPSFIETVYLWPNNLGYCKWILIKNIILMGLCLCVLVAGSKISIQQIIEMYS